MFLSSLLSMAVLLVLVYLAEYSLNIVVDLVWLYEQGVSQVQDGNKGKSGTYNNHY